MQCFAFPASPNYDNRENITVPTMPYLIRSLAHMTAILLFLGANVKRADVGDMIPAASTNSADTNQTVDRNRRQNHEKEDVELEMKSAGLVAAMVRKRTKTQVQLGERFVFTL